MNNEETLLFSVTELKQFSYCERIFFYQRCLPHLRPVTYKMKAGIDEHKSEEKRALRRNFSQYEEEGGVRTFDLALRNPALKLTAKIDEVVETTSGDLFPVDYKMADRASEHYKVQLTAYALLLEAAYQRSIQHGFLYLINKREMVEVKFTEKLRNQVRRLVEEMKTIIDSELMPEPTPQRSRCIDCEFRRFCNDVL